jgi:hypothetical protein
MITTSEEAGLLEWQRMARHALRLLHQDARLEPLRTAEERVCLSCHSRAVWAHAVPRGRGEYELEERIEAEE